MPGVARLILACAFLLTLAPRGFAGELVTARDLAADAQTARGLRQPIVLFFTQAGCIFCERARAAYLRPLAARDDPALKALLREVPIESTLGGFDGKPVTGSDLARALGVRMFPTVVFLDSRGTHIAEALIGYTVPDFYGAYFEQRLDASIRRLSP